MATTESQLRSKANILFSYWTSYFGPFNGPRLHTGIVQRANKPLLRKYIRLISAFVRSLPPRRIVELVVSGNDGFLISEIWLREFFTSWETVEWRLTIRPKIDSSHAVRHADYISKEGMTLGWAQNIGCRYTDWHSWILSRPRSGYFESLHIWDTKTLFKLRIFKQWGFRQNFRVSCLLWVQK